jgi:hypothetical protein
MYVYACVCMYVCMSEHVYSVCVHVFTHMLMLNCKLMLNRKLSFDSRRVRIDGLWHNRTALISALSVSMH